MYELYLTTNNELYSNQKFVDVDNILLYIDGVFYDLNNVDVSNNIGFVPTTAYTELVGRVDNNTLLLAQKIDTIEFDQLASLKANLEDIVTADYLNELMTPKPIISGPTSIVEKTTVTLTIDNFVSTQTYYISTDYGTYTFDTSNGTIEFTAIGTDLDITANIKVQTIEEGKLLSFPTYYNFTIEPVPFTADQYLINSDYETNEEDSTGIEY